MQYFLWNTHPMPVTNWQAFGSREAALSEAQTIIDLLGVGNEIWIEDGNIRVSGHARHDWSLSIYDGIDAALEAIADLDPEYRAAQQTMILRAAAGEAPPPPPRPSRFTAKM